MIGATFYNADCMEWLKTCGDGAFDLAVVDPPYGICVNTNMGRRRGDMASDYHKFAGGDTDAPPPEYFTEIARVADKLVIWGANHFIDRLPEPRGSACWLMWDKGFSDEVSFAQFELAWTNLSGTCKKFDKHPSDKWRIHPTQKPVDLYAWIYAMYAEEGQTVLDTHMGSGSSAIAAHRAGLAFTGIELDEVYFNKAVERYHGEIAQGDMFAT